MTCLQGAAAAEDPLAGGKSQRGVSPNTGGHPWAVLGPQGPVAVAHCQLLRSTYPPAPCHMLQTHTGRDKTYLRVYLGHTCHLLELLEVPAAPLGAWTAAPPGYTCTCPTHPTCWLCCGCCHLISTCCWSRRAVYTPAPVLDECVNSWWCG